MEFRFPLLRTFGFCCALGALMLAAPPARGQGARAESLQDLNGSLVDLADRVSPSVVQILVAGYGLQRQGNEGSGNADVVVSRQRAIGSGVIVDPGGYIMTNAHVVAGAEHIQVALLPPASGLQALHPSELHHTRTLDATLVGKDTDLDLALLKVNSTGLPALKFAEYRSLRQGEMVFAFGSPEGLANSMSFGVVSSVARQPDPDSAMVYVQTDAPINPGNSGGPLVNIQGDIVGLNTFIVTSSGGSQGLGFAIPSNQVRFAYGQLRRFGHVHRALIGVNAQTITPALAAGLKLPQDWGLLISDVVPDGPAAKAGVKIDDIVFSIDGQQAGSLPVFEHALQPHVDGDTVRLQVLRDGQKVELEVPVVVAHHSYDQLTDLADAEKDLVPALGIVGIDITPRVADLVGSLRITSGVIVAAKTAEPSGFETPLQAGDVIHGLNGKPVTGIDDLRAALKDIAPNGPLVLQVEREGHLLYVTQE
ncbi:MAG TPA: trypsin-like peptidase domain-containing protein [Terriglobia bacterium]|nr:trypsin-like peptidase domain-containing protein [Terriglobia bacterium]